jgi:dTMP kinase
MLVQRLEAAGIPCLATRQPSDSAVGKIMRQATDARLPLENETMALLVAADRYQHVFDLINPALEAGKTVVCDRYYYSSFAFQGIDPEAFKRVAAYNERVMAHRKPDITFFLDVPPDACMRRLGERHDNGLVHLYDTVAQQTAVRERYMTIFAQLREHERIVFIDGNQNKAAIAAEVWDRLGLETPGNK